MFLGKLNEESKELFLQLSVHAALSNNDLAREQGDLINEYCLELGISNYEVKIKKNLDELLEEINNKTTREEKNIIIFEIAALIMSDNKYDSLEQQFMNTLKEKLEITAEKLDEIFNLINELRCVYKNISEIINNV